MLFCFGTVSHRLQPTRLSDVLKLKNLKTTWGRKNIMLFWVMDPKNFWCISLQNVLLLTCLTCQSYYMGSIATLHLFFFNFLIFFSVLFLIFFYIYIYIYICMYIYIYWDCSLEKYFFKISLSESTFHFQYCFTKEYFQNYSWKKDIFEIAFS